jgi:shikimate kinase
MTSRRIIIITGFMGAGKTTVARALERRLDGRMIDLDCFITERERHTPAALIDALGEEKFREAETRALEVLLKSGTVHVIALGGGAWTVARNRALIHEHQCFTVWLDAPFELCWKRIADTRDQLPLARDLEQARQLYDQRRMLYDLAALRIEMDEAKSAQAIAAEIVAALSEAADD